MTFFTGLNLKYRLVAASLAVTLLGGGPRITEFACEVSRQCSARDRQACGNIGGVEGVSGIY